MADVVGVDLYLVYLSDLLEVVSWMMEKIGPRTQDGRTAIYSKKKRLSKMELSHITLPYLRN